ncbi:phenylacetate--CoA ligase family protein [Streptomyces sp. H39-S7]|uniref:phenylacetate--CoA ligase family protein n=1 Tax=Streptomyces sp. H39-S7 TaxID=3004357 RepID=UPI0022AF750A|nr:phenylacetate--CoA ligase family protein [Streptomyces sp. H39-S7]MCZ4122423.1 phenylacetate--CoA ligase family protein [Streptomyces sp. H39-S7]
MAMGSFARQWLLRIISFGLTALYRLYRVHPFVWRVMARNYRPWMSGFARLHAWMTCQFAALDVPAYATHLEQGGWRFRWFRLDSYPATDKETYVKAYPEEARCWKGRVEIAGSVVDESSGSSGTPYNWVRSRRELNTVHRNVAGYTSLVFPSKRLFVINAYSMGAWATGTNTGIAMARIATVKNTGPDLEKIVDTLRHFGPRYDYLVTAYPPFLKHLRDRLAGEPWFAEKSFRLAAMVGGEGMTEALRDYVGDVFGKVRSGYGASDLTIGMGGETTFSVWLRRMMREDAAVRAAFLGPDEQRLPMVFQYNPLETYLETAGDGRTGEVLCTINSTAVMAPKLRYNIGDEGTLMSFPQVWEILRELFADRPVLLQRAEAAALREKMRLPLLFLYGRADSTISYMGANIYPQDVEYGLYEGNPMADRIESFCLAIEEGDDLEARPVVHVQLREGTVLDAGGAAKLAEVCRAGVVRHLAACSRDFAQSLTEDASAGEVSARVHPYGSGPFVRGTGTAAGGSGHGIKNKYLLGATAKGGA